MPFYMGGMLPVFFAGFVFALGDMVFYIRSFWHRCGMARNRFICGLDIVFFPSRACYTQKKMAV